MEMLITKANGKQEPFDEHKFRRSIRRAHIPKEYHEKVVESVKNKLYNGIPTKEIYAQVTNFFEKTYPAGACTYNLKQSIMDLGPSGYPFERYVGAMLSRRGYEVKVGTTIRGKCVSHEIDVIAEKEHEHFMVECKFHNQHGLRSDVKVPLYVWARYQDVLQNWLAQETEQEKNALHQAWVMTNTKFSTDAIQYGECVGMKLVGWNYPDEGNLQDFIESARLHPITCLSSLGLSEKQLLLERDIVIASDLEHRPEVLQELHLPQSTITQVQQELEALKNCLVPQ
jgi:Holliday junction resolvase